MFPNNLFNSSSFLIAKRICLGIILDFLLSLAALPASSKTSAARYSSTAARQTEAPAPTLSAYLPVLINLAILPTGNCSPALLDLETDFTPTYLPFPPFAFPAIKYYYIIFRIELKEKIFLLIELFGKNIKTNRFYFLILFYNLKIKINILINFLYIICLNIKFKHK